MLLIPGFKYIALMITVQLKTVVNIVFNSYHIFRVYVFQQTGSTSLIKSHTHKKKNKRTKFCDVGPNAMDVCEGHWIWDIRYLTPHIQCT